MDFFEKIGKKASETYKTAAEKTNKIASDTKLKLKISENKSKIDDVYAEIGKKVYQKFVLDGNLDIKDDIKEELDKIKALTDEIEEYEAQRLDISNMRQCPQCKNSIEKTAKFCPICGAEQPEIKDEETATGKNITEEDGIENETSTEENLGEDKPNVAENVAEDVAENVAEEISNNDENKQE